MPFKFPAFITTDFSAQPPKKPDAGRTQEAPAAPSDSGADERRIHQRFVARLHGEPCFWACIGEESFPLDDLSLKGFALAATTRMPKGTQFDFTLQRQGIPDIIQGRAEAVGVFGKDALSIGCRITHFEDDGAQRLKDWLIAHVIRCATVRISEKDAAAIVSGHSLI
ncbi:MAG: PilZ domain-containing protein [Azoarcus sp.]|jgi:hypothetical protein|nr:PilZ domain-containing protein [Azoarcus sp.]